MTLLIALGIILAVGVGLITKIVTDKTGWPGGNRTITWPEFAVCAVAIAAVIIPTTTWLGVKIAQHNAVTYHEYWSGFEASADQHTTTCTRDGACTHTYRCDHYTVTETRYRTETYTTVENGKSVTKTRQVPYPVTVDKYHQCPLTTTENTFTVTTTLGDTYTLGNHWLPANPGDHRWRNSGDSYGQSTGGIPSGTPTPWTAAKQRISSGHPGGATKRANYDNYVLASQSSILHKYSPAIDRYRNLGVLPDPAHTVHDNYLADKAYFVGSGITDHAAWQQAMMTFNGALGTQRQGDLHLIIVTDNRITNRDEYALAVQARWQAPALGKDALSKNGLVVIAGSTDGGRTVAWARAFTGMPVGNEALNTAIASDLPGTTLTPNAVLGSPTVRITNDKPVITHSNGVLEHDVFNKPGYTRISMHGGKDDAGFKYLLSEVKPSGTAKTLIVTVGLVIAIALWALALFLDFPIPFTRRTPPTPTARTGRSGYGLA